MNCEQKVVPQIRTKLNLKQGSFSQVQIHTSVLISSIQEPQVLTLNQGANRNGEKNSFHKCICWLVVDIHIHPLQQFSMLFSMDFIKRSRSILFVSLGMPVLESTWRPQLPCRANYSHPFVSCESQANMTSCSLPSSLGFFLDLVIRLTHWRDNTSIIWI